MDLDQLTPIVQEFGIVGVVAAGVLQVVKSGFRGWWDGLSFWQKLAISFAFCFAAGLAHALLIAGMAIGPALLAAMSTGMLALGVKSTLSVNPKKKESQALQSPAP